jgi:hypothetical protein
MPALYALHRKKAKLRETNTRIIAAVVVVQIIDEGSFFSVVEEHPNHAEATKYFRISLLNHPAFSPLRKLTVDYPIANF